MQLHLQYEHNYYRKVIIIAPLAVGLQCNRYQM